MTKWGDRPHWEFDALLLGSDRHGDWIGIPAHTPMVRPGATFTPPVDSVVLVPGGGPGWLATFYAPGFRVEVYVDITTPAVWDGRVLRATDLDLDVVRGEKGRVWVDDEDEFADHRLRYGYPEEVVAEASRTCTTVHAAIRAGDAPFDGQAPSPWLHDLARRTG
jgi:hypothetical protein